MFQKIELNVTNLFTPSLMAICLSPEFLAIEESILISCQLKSMIYFKVHSLHFSYCVHGQRYNELYSQLEYQTDSFISLEIIMCAVCSSLDSQQLLDLFTFSVVFAFSIMKSYSIRRFCIDFFHLRMPI